MKRNEFKEFKNKSIDELKKSLRENQSRLQSLRFDLASGKVKNVSEIYKTKKDIARILTVINST